MSRPRILRELVTITGTINDKGRSFGRTSVVYRSRRNGHVHWGCRSNTRVNTKGVPRRPVSLSLRSQGCVGCSRSVYPGRGVGFAGRRPRPTTPGGVGSRAVWCRLRAYRVDSSVCQGVATSTVWRSAGLVNDPGRWSASTPLGPHLLWVS